MPTPDRSADAVRCLVVDVATCEPVKENFVEIWATNATGVYAGVTANSNGDGSAANLVSLCTDVR